jgi:hypothetical protein
MPDIAKSRATRTACTALCIAAGLPLSGCFFDRKKPPRPFVPPPPIEARIPPMPQELRLPEPGEDPVTEIEYLKIVTVVGLPPAPAKPAPSKPASATKAPPAVAEPVITPAPNVPGPKPTTIISAAERQQMTQELNAIQEKVKKILDRAGGRNLPTDLAKLATDARNFWEQAEQARDRDLPTAVSYAKRAEFFANDLNSRLP